MVTGPSRQSGSSEAGPGRLLDFLATDKGAVIISLAGVAIAIVSLLTSAPIKRIAILAPILFGLLLWLAWRGKRKKRIVGSSLLFFFSLLLTIRIYSAPNTITIFYDGAVLDTSSIPYSQGSIPLTDDPHIGYIRAHIYSDEPAELEISCTQQGLISDGTHSAKMKWAHIVGGKYQTLWAPMPFVRGEAVGAARTLLPCSNWRWRIQ
jgi:hypothetical protein